MIGASPFQNEEAVRHERLGPLQQRPLLPTVGHAPSAAALDANGLDKPPDGDPIAHGQVVAGCLSACGDLGNNKRRATDPTGTGQ